MNCPICDSGNHRILLRHKKDRFVKKLSCPKIQFVLCRTCGLAFQNPQPDDTTLSHFYKQGEFDINAPKKYFDSSKEDACEKMDWLKTNLGHGNKKKLLEIGSSSGILLNEFKKNGWNVFGIEPSIPFSEYSRNNFHLNIQTGFFDEKTFPGEKFDLIIALHVLEHIKNPIKFLEILASKLTDKGVLFLEVPNIFGMRFDRSIYEYFCSIHMMMFTPKTIVGLLRKAKYNIRALSITKRGISLLAIPGGNFIMDSEKKSDIICTIIKHQFMYLLSHPKKILSFLWK